MLGAPGAVAGIRVDLHDVTQIQSMCGERRRIRNVRRRDEHDTLALAREFGQCRHEQRQLAEAVVREQDFAQASARPAAAGQLCVEFGQSGWNRAHVMRRTGRAAPDAGMFQDCIECDGVHVNSDE